MVFGADYATADDVVGHELTHGYVERTSNLFSIYQSGAINESVADTIGEIVDHRNGVDNDSAWTLGEVMPGGALRSMQNPTLRFQGQPSQPDRMTSPYFEKGEAGADLYGDNDDNGAVHRNDGVGNKTAYLISQGGTFNGQTITGIDSRGHRTGQDRPALPRDDPAADLGRRLRPARPGAGQHLPDPGGHARLRALLTATRWPRRWRRRSWRTRPRRAGRPRRRWRCRARPPRRPST